MGPGCDEKLKLLKINLNLMISQSDDQPPREIAKLKAFLETITDTQGVVEAYGIPTYKFMWAFNITPDFRSYVAGTVISSITTLAIGFMVTLS